MINNFSHLNNMSGLDDSTKSLLGVFHEIVVNFMNLKTSFGAITESCCSLGTTLILSVTKMHFIKLLLDLDGICTGGIGRRQPQSRIQEEMIPEETNPMEMALTMIVPEIVAVTRITGTRESELEVKVEIVMLGHPRGQHWHDQWQNSCRGHEDCVLQNWDKYLL